MLQVYKRMFQGMFTANLGWGAAGWELGSLTDVAEYKMGEYLKANAGVVAQHLQNLGSENVSIHNISAQDSSNLQKLMRTLGMDTMDLTKDGVPVSEIVSKMNEFAGQQSDVMSASRTAQATHANTVSGSNNPYAWSTVELYDTVVDANNNNNRTSDFATTEGYSAVSTSENVSSVRNNLAFKNRNRQIDNAELASEVNMWSLRWVVSSLSASELSELNTRITSNLNYEENGDATFVWALLFKWNNVKVVRDAIKDLGYNSRWDFGWVEASYVAAFIKDTNENQQEVVSMSRSAKIDRLLDFNRNGALDGATDFYVWEGQMKSNLTLLSQMSATGKFDTLLRAIGLNPATFEQDMNTNFFAAREMFKRHLGTAIEAGFQPQVLVQWKTAEFTKAQFELQDQYIANIENELLRDSKIKAALDAADPRLARGALKSIAQEILSMELAWAAAIVTPEGLTAWASVAVTEKYNISLALANGTPVIGVSRKVIEGERLNVSVGVGAALQDGTIKGSPFTSAEYLLRKGYSEADIKSLFPDTLPDRGFRVSGYATATFAWVNGWVNIDKNKAPVIADIVRRVESQLDSIFDGTYVSTGPDDQAMADMILDRYTEAARLLSADDPRRGQLKASIKKGYLTYLEDNLYADNSGLDLTWVGISYICGHFPIITLQLEKLDQDWGDVDNTGTAAEMLSTSVNSQLSRIGWKEVMHNGNKVVYLDWVQAPNVSADARSAAQVEFIEGGWAYVSGSNLSLLTNGTYVDENNNHSRVLVIGDGAYNGTELVPGGYSEGITSSIPTSTRTETVTNYDKPIYRTVDTTSTSTQSVGSPEVRFYHLDNFRSVVDAKIKSWSIINENKEATPLAKFQKDVVAAGRDIDSNELSTLWKSLSSGNLNTFMAAEVGPEFNQALTNAVSEDEKLFVIESIMMAMRNDLSTMWNGFGDNVSEISGGKSLREYYESSTMKKRMIENLDSSTAFSYSSIESAYTSLMNMQIDGVVLGEMNKFVTQMSYADVVSSSAASQVIKEKSFGPDGEKEKYAWIRDTSISFSSGVHETIGISAPVAMTDSERREAIANLPNRFIQRKVNEVNSLTGGNYGPEDIRNALANNTSLGGVSLSYYASITFTGNCLNLQIDEGVTLTQTVTSGGQTQEIIGYETDTVTYEENTIQVKEALFNWVRHASNSAQVFALGGWGWENNDDADTSTGTEREEDATTSTGTEDWTVIDSDSSENLAGWADGVVTGWDEVSFGGSDSSENLAGWADGVVTGWDEVTDFNQGWKSIGDSLLSGLTVANKNKKIK